MELIKGGIYKVHARNFDTAVYDGDEGFIGVRVKFGAEYLDTEYLNHTVRPKELIGQVPQDIGDIHEDNKQLFTMLKLAYPREVWQRE